MQIILLLTVAISIAPIFWLLMLAFFASASHGSFRLVFSPHSAFLNFTSALSGEAGTSFFHGCLATIGLSSSTALIACVIAVPIAARLSKLGPAVSQQLIGLFIATRLIPITAALPVLIGVLDVLKASSGFISVGAIYVMLFLPLSCACISAADWNEATRAACLLEFDEPLSPKRRLVFFARSLSNDLAVAIVLVFLLTWSEFYIALSALPPGIKTLAKHFATFDTIDGYLWGPLAASLVLCLIPLAAGAAIVEVLVKTRIRNSRGAF